MTLPEGQVVYLQPVDGLVVTESEDRDDNDRAALHAELEASLAEEARASPGRYATHRSGVVRRILLGGTKYHLYYRYHADRDELVVLTVWGAVRERGPKL